MERVRNVSKIHTFYFFAQSGKFLLKSEGLSRERRVDSLVQNEAQIPIVTSVTENDAASKGEKAKPMGPHCHTGGSSRAHDVDPDRYFTCG